MVPPRRYPARWSCEDLAPDCSKARSAEPVWYGRRTPLQVAPTLRISASLTKSWMHQRYNALRIESWSFKIGRLAQQLNVDEFENFIEGRQELLPWDSFQRMTFSGQASRVLRVLYVRCIFTRLELKL